MMQLLWKTLWWFLKKLKIELASDPACPLLNIYNTKELKVGSGRAYLHSPVHSSMIHRSQEVQPPRCLPTDEWISRSWYLFTTEPSFGGKG